MLQYLFAGDLEDLEEAIDNLLNFTVLHTSFGIIHPLSITQNQAGKGFIYNFHGTIFLWDLDFCPYISRRNHSENYYNRLLQTSDFCPSP